jgi:hypothetical protein
MGLGQLVGRQPYDRQGLRRERYLITPAVLAVLRADLVSETEPLSSWFHRQLLIEQFRANAGLCVSIFLESSWRSPPVVFTQYARIPCTDFQPIPRHSETLPDFGCWRSVRWRALILSMNGRTSTPRLACSAPMPRCLGGPPLPGQQGIEKDRLSSDCLLRHPIGLRLERLRRRTMTCCVLQQYSGIADLYLVRALAEIATNIIDSCSLVSLAT